MTDRETTGTETATATATAPVATPDARLKTAPPWNVVLLDDDDHTYDYVIRMMQELFRHPRERAYQMARTVDSTGRVVCATVHKELAELKRDQILAYGADPLLARSRGAMSATIEPAAP